MEQTNPSILVQVPSYSVASALHWPWALRSVSGGEFQGSDQGIGGKEGQSLNPSNWSWIKFCYVPLCLFFETKTNKRSQCYFEKLILLSCPSFPFWFLRHWVDIVKPSQSHVLDSPWNGLTKIAKHLLPQKSIRWNLKITLLKWKIIWSKSPWLTSFPSAEASGACKSTQTALVLAVGQGSLNYQFFFGDQSLWVFSGICPEK